LNTSQDFDVDSIHTLKEIIEDSVEYWCDENRSSGQTAWTAVNVLSAMYVKVFDEAGA
tara:strand:+ start:979 stop:1152 length:174 start_codon:yes stop_codon:yes gene_type:complete